MTQGWAIGVAANDFNPGDLVTTAADGALTAITAARSITDSADTYITVGHFLQGSTVATDTSLIWMFVDIK
jgi:hypothetical protein